MRVQNFIDKGAWSLPHTVEVCAVCLAPPIRTRYLPWFICMWIPSNAALARYCACQIWVHPDCMQRLVENRNAKCIYCRRLYTEQRGALGTKLVMMLVCSIAMTTTIGYLVLCILLWGLHKISSGSYWEPFSTANGLIRLWYTYCCLGGFLFGFCMSSHGRAIPVDLLAVPGAALLLFFTHGGSAWLTPQGSFWILFHFVVLNVTSLWLTFDERRKSWYYLPNEVSWG